MKFTVQITLLQKFRVSHAYLFRMILISVQVMNMLLHMQKFGACRTGV